MPDIRHLVFIKSSADNIYSAITTKEGIAAWWSPHNNAKNEVGFTFRISFGGDYYKEIRIKELKPNEYVEWEITHAHPEWLNTTVTFSITIKNGKSELRFGHNNWSDYTDLFAQCTHDWGVFLEYLKEYCEIDS